MTAASDASEPGGGSPPRSRGRWVVTSLVVVTGLVLVFGLVTSVTGFPGPGALRRYRSAELAALERKINASVAAGASRACGAARGPLVHASVNPLTSRVEVRGGTGAGAFPRLSTSERAMIASSADATFTETTCADP